MPDSYARDIAISIVSTPEDIAVGAGSVQSSVCPQGARFARLCATADARFLIGPNPTALATSSLLPAGTVEYVSVNPGWRVAVIQNSGAGVCSLSWCE